MCRMRRISRHESPELRPVVPKDGRGGRRHPRVCDPWVAWVHGDLEAQVGCTRAICTHYIYAAAFRALWYSRIAHLPPKAIQCTVYGCCGSQERVVLAFYPPALLPLFCSIHANRYRDFQVTEVDLEGQEAQLTCLDPPPQVSHALQQTFNGRSTAATLPPSHSLVDSWPLCCLPFKLLCSPSLCLPPTSLQSSLQLR